MKFTNIDGYEQGAAEIRRMGREVYGEIGRIVFTNGCFDIIHPGHIRTLKYARELAGPKGIVVVGLNSDASVKKLKGSDRPVMDQQARAIVALSIKFVDFLMIFDEETPEKLIKAVKPDIIVKGGDYKPDDVVGSDQAVVMIAPFVEGFSTSDIIGRIK